MKPLIFCILFSSLMAQAQTWEPVWKMTDVPYLTRDVIDNMAMMKAGFDTDGDEWGEFVCAWTDEDTNAILMYEASGDNVYQLGTWLVLASTDVMAADATTARILNHYVDSIRQLRMGYDMGLGEIRPDRIGIIGEKLQDVTVEWVPAVLKNRAALHRPQEMSYGLG